MTLGQGNGLVVEHLFESQTHTLFVYLFFETRFLCQTVLELNLDKEQKKYLAFLSSPILIRCMIVKNNSSCELI